MKILARALPFILLLGLGLACNTVSKEQLQNVKVGDKIIYRYKKPDGKEWMYADKVTKIDGDKVYFNPGKMEATSKNDSRLDEFVSDKEDSINKADLLKYAEENGDDHKVVIEIR